MLPGIPARLVAAGRSALEVQRARPLLVQMNKGRRAAAIPLVARLAVAQRPLAALSVQQAFVQFRAVVAHTALKDHLLASSYAKPDSPPARRL